MTTKFKYVGVNSGGKTIKGQLSAETMGAATDRLKSMGMVPMSVKPAGTGLNAEINLPGSDRVPLKELAIMSRQFATMISSGLSLLRALTILAEQTEHKALQKAITEVRREVSAGVSLSAAMAKHDQAFPPIFINMVRAGEVGGFLEDVLVQSADNFEKEVKLRAKVKSAMTYPVVVFIMAILAVTAMLIFIVPIFENMFSGLGSELPLPTRILVALSDGLLIFGPVGTVAGVVGFFWWQRIKNRDSTRKVVDPLLLKVPIFGGLVQKIALSRFARNFGTMLRAGVPILQCLSIVGETSGNYVVTEALRDVQNSVKRGESFAGPLLAHSVFPAMMIQMLAVGEDTGSMDAMLYKLSDFYDQEVETTTEQLSSLIEPLMIAVLGIIIGAMIIGLYMPIFSIFNVIGNQ